MTEELQQAIDALLSKETPSVLRQVSGNVSQIYLQGKGSDAVFGNELLRLCYIATRMPAIYGAALAVLRLLPVAPASFIDLGAGPGTASWAAISLFPGIKSLILIEKNSHAIALGKKLATGHRLFEKAEWIHASLPRDLPSADAAILSYSLGELDQPSRMIDHWLHAEIPLLILLEPGTPRGFSLIRRARDQLLNAGAFLIAPCPHALPCPLKEKNWCHFSARISRGKLHRYVKGGSLGYEDEKYSYLIASRQPILTPKHSRILRHPQKQNGHVRLTLCTDEGIFMQTGIGRSHHDLYRKAREAKWGDDWDCIPK